MKMDRVRCISRQIVPIRKMDFITFCKKGRLILPSEILDIEREEMLQNYREFRKMYMISIGLSSTLPQEVMHYLSF